MKNKKRVIGITLSLLFIMIASLGVLNSEYLIKASDREKNSSLEVGVVTEETFYKIPVKLILPAFEDGEAVIQAEGIHLLASEILEDIKSKYPEEKVSVSANEKDQSITFNYKKDPADLVLEFNVSLLDESSSLKMKLLSGEKIVTTINRDYSELKKKVKDNEAKLAEVPSIVNRSLIQPRASNPISVNSWATFVAAIKNASYDEINLTADLTANARLGTTVTRSVVINGNGKTINIGNSNYYPIELGTVTTEQTISLKNVNLTGTNSTLRQAFVKTATNGGSNWNILFDNVNTLVGNQTALVYAPNAFVKITGTSLFDNSTGTAEAFITAMKLHITDQAKLSGKLTSDFYKSSLAYSEVLIDKASQVDFSSTSRIVSITGGNSNFTIQGDPTLKTRENNTQLKLTSTDINRGDNGGLFNFNTGNPGPPVNLNVQDYATIIANSNASASTPVVMIEAVDSQFNVSNHSYMEMKAEGQSNTRGATVRFRYSGNSSFNATENSMIKIVKKSGSQAAIRMNGGGNSVNIASGSKFFATSYGDGRPANPAAVGNSTIEVMDNNQAIGYLNDSDSNPADSFTITGTGSVAKMDSKYGAAIDAAGAVNVKVGEGAFFETNGNTAGGPMFRSARGAINFDMTKPTFYDFRNNAASGGELLRSPRSTASYFEATNSDISLWKKGSNLDGSPYYDRSLVTYKLTGADLGLNVSPDNDFTTKFGGMNSSINQYSRIAANNSSPVIDGLRIPTNSDKFIYGHVSVLEGFDDNGNRMIRDAWDNEAQVRVKLEFPDGTAKIVQGTTYEGPAAIYESTNQTGYFKISLDDFIPAGTKVSIEEAWRGPADATEQQKHTSGAEDIKVSMVEAIDVTPPTQAVVATDLNNATKQLSGTSDENGAKIFVKVNDQWLKDAGGQAVSTTVSSGKWLLDLPKYLTKTDKVDIYVKDTTTINPLPAYPLPDTYTQEPDGVFGNINVDVNGYENYQGYHDAVKSGTKDERFNQAKRLTVNDVLPDKPGLAKTAKSSGGETTSIGDVITYTLKVSNNKADSQDWKNIQLVDKIPEGLIFDPLNHGITISGSPVGGNRFKYDDQTRTLTIAVGNISAKKLKTITFNATVSQNAVVGQDIINIAEANGDSPQEKPFVQGPINPNSEHESISVKSGGAGVPGGEIMGSLSFISAPTALDFGVQTEKLNGKTIAVEPTIVGEQLVVSDNRKDLKKWTMFAAVLTPLANGDTILPSAIHYVNGNSDEVITGLSKEIFSHTNKNAGEYNISEEEWEKKGNGFKVELPPGAVNKLGKYQATIQFTLSDAY